MCIRDRSGLRRRRIWVAGLEDEFEAVFDRGWTDGLTVVPPTEARVLRMLEGTTRAPDDIVTVVPPDLVEPDRLGEPRTPYRTGTALRYASWR